MANKIQSGYLDILKDIKNIIIKARYNAFTAVNTEMLKAYFEKFLLVKTGRQSSKWNQRSPQ